MIDDGYQVTTRPEADIKNIDEKVIIQPLIEIEISEETNISYLSWKKALKQVLSLAVPYSLNGYVITAGIFINTLIFANFGDDELAASAITSATALFTVAVAKASFASTSEVTARNFRTENKLGIILQQSWVQAIIESIPLIILTSFNKPIFLALGQEPKIVEIANQYLLSYNAAIPAILLLKSGEKFVIAVGRPQTALFFNILNTAFSTSLGYLLALGELGFPKLGISGIAHATTIGAWLSFTGMSLYFYFDKQFQRYNIFSRGDLNRIVILKQLFALGTPIALQTLLESSQFFLQTTMIGLLGKSSLSAEQIVLQYTGLVTSPVLSIAAVTGILVGRDITSNNAVNVRKLGYTALMIGTIFSLTGLVIFSVAAKPLTSVFISKDNENFESVLSIAKLLFFINGINGVADALRNISAGGLSGFYDVVAPTLITFMGLWIVGTPAAVIFSFPLKLGVNGLLSGKGIGLFLASMVLLKRWQIKCDNPTVAIREGQEAFLSRNKNIFFCRSPLTSDEKVNSRTPLIVALPLSDESDEKEEKKYGCFTRVRCSIL